MPSLERNHFVPPFGDLYTPLFVPAYSVAGVVGSTRTDITELAMPNPRFLGLHDDPPSRDFSTPPGNTPAESSAA